MQEQDRSGLQVLDLESGEGWHQGAELGFEHPQLVQVERGHRRSERHLSPHFAVLGDVLRLQVSVAPQLSALKREQLPRLPASHSAGHLTILLSETRAASSTASDVFQC